MIAQGPFSPGIESVVTAAHTVPQGLSTIKADTVGPIARKVL